MARLGTALSVLLTTCAHGALAADCTDIQALERHAESKSIPRGATCALYLSDTGTTGTSCHWEFPFRDQAALTFSDVLWQSLATCRAGRPLGADQPVNHPDSYELREWATPTGTYAISVKDKGALDRTMVFFRLESAANN